MSAILRFFLRQHVPLNITFFALLTFGFFIAFPNIPVDQFPNINMGKYTITTSYPGASARNVERLVTEVLEDSMRDMEGIEYVNATSISGLSVMLIQFQDDLNFTTLYNDLRMRVLGVQNLLPTFNGKPLRPTFTANDIDEWVPVIQLNLQHSHDSPQLHRRSLNILAKELRTQLERIPHVKKVLLLGIEPQQYTIALNPDALETYAISMRECIQALRTQGHSMAGGSLANEQGASHIGAFTIVLDDTAQRPEDIFSSIIRRDANGNHLTLDALIQWQETGIRTLHGGVRTSVNGRDNVTCKIIKTSSGNASTIKTHALRIRDAFVAAHADDHIVCPSSLDSTHKINDSMSTLVTSLIAACVLVVLTLFWFLTKATTRTLLIGSSLAIIACIVIASSTDSLLRGGALAAFMFYVFYHSRASVLIFSGILFSFIGSIIVFYFLGYSLNEITLLGFVLTIGIIVDDAIIVLENIRRHREAGASLRDAAVTGTSEVFWPVVSATLTTLAAFLPMLIMTGAVGQFFAMVPKAVAVALCISLIECIIFLPLHSVDLNRILGDEELDRHDTGDFLHMPGFIGTMHRIYDRLLRWVFAHPWKTSGVITCMFLTSLASLILSSPKYATELGIAPPLRMNFFPSDTTQLWIRVSMPHGSDATDTDTCSRAIATLLCARPKTEITNITTIAGLNLDSSYNPHYSHQNAFIIVELARGSQRSFSNPHAFIADIDQQLTSIYAAQGVRILVEAMKDGPPINSPVSVQISGSDDHVVEQLANDVYAWMQSEMITDAREPSASHQHRTATLAGIKTLFHDRQQRQDVLTFHFNDHALSRYGITSVQAQQHFSAIYDGAWIGDLRRSDSDIPIRVELAASDTHDLDRMLSLPIQYSSSADNGSVRFHDIGSVSVHARPAALIRKNFQRTITISGTLHPDGLYSSSFVADWYARNKDRYVGAQLTFSGEAEGTSRSFHSLFVAFLIAVFLIYTILAAQFKSYTQPLIIMSNIGFSFIGVVLVMSLFGIGAHILGPTIIRPERSWFTMQCMMAVVGLAGLVVNDAIVLIDFINQRRNDGLPLREALFTAGHQRMRAIVMTTITTIAGLLPMAIGLPEFSLRWSPFATAFIAGISVSTAMTLLIIPLLYLHNERLCQRCRNIFSHRRK